MNYPTPPSYPNVSSGANGAASPFKISLWTKIKLALSLVGLLIAGGFYLFITHRSAENMVLFENSLESAGELVIDGASKGELAPRAHLLLSLKSGSHTITLKGPRGALDEGTLDVPKKASFGYHGLYVLGGKSGVAVVTKYYGKDAAFEDKVDIVPLGTRLVELPSTSVMTPIDAPFPESIRTTKNAMSPSVMRVCHLDLKHAPTCPGW